MRLRYASVEILSTQMFGARRATIPESEAFRTRHEVPRVKKETRDETYHYVTEGRDSLDVDRRIPVTETEVEFCDL